MIMLLCYYYYYYYYKYHPPSCLRPRLVIDTVFVLAIRIRRSGLCGVVHRSIDRCFRFIEIVILLHRTENHEK